MSSGEVYREWKILAQQRNALQVSRARLAAEVAQLLLQAC